jgi:23S rRNA pseudouridine1911/1915/1917 synthase
MNKVRVLFEDKTMLAIYKPAGLVVNRAESVKEKTVQDWMEASYGELFQVPVTSLAEQVFIERSGVAHRIDKETSGILLIGKTLQALSNLMKQFRKRQVAKTYEVLVHGKFQPTLGEIRAPIRRSLTNRHHFEVHIGGKPAETGYQVIQYLIHPQIHEYQGGFSRVRCYPKTGRTHQIRVHMRLVGHPLVSDLLYGPKRRIKLDLTWCPRHFLHASQIQFAHPSTGKTMSIQSKLPDDLRTALEHLE